MLICGGRERLSLTTNSKKSLVMTTVPEREVDHNPAAVTSWISACPGGLWKVHRRWLGPRLKGANTPMMGSLCKVKVVRKSDSEENTLQRYSDDLGSAADVDSSLHATSYPRTHESVLQVPMDEWFLLCMGEGQCDIIEGCLEGMKAGEICEFTVSAWNEKTSSVVCGDVTQTESTTRQLCFILQLHSFTSGKESWQLTPGEKWTWVLSHKQWGGQRFGNGDIWGASDSYCRAVKLAITLQCKTRGHAKEDCKNALTSSAAKEDDDGTSDVPTEEEYKTLKAELHSNLSLCQFKLGQFGKARDGSIKATELNPNNVKAWYRLGQARLQLGELDESRTAFEKILELQPDSASARAALKQVNLKLKDLDSKLSQRLSKMFN